MEADLVFEGGGVKGIGLAGAFCELEAQQYEPQCVAGTSAGAVRMSMSIPVFFKPVRRGGHEIVDGGILSNFPVWLFDAPAGVAPRFPTFGLLLVAPHQAAPLLPHAGKAQPIRSDIAFVKA